MKDKHKRVVALIPVDLVPKMYAKMREYGFTSASGYIRYLVMKELRKQKKVKLR